MHYLIIVMTFFILSCGSVDPLEHFNQDIKRLGFIPYPKPLSYAGTGTLVGGSPAEMMIISAPDTCFPSGFGPDSGNLRRIDETAIPARGRQFSFKGDARFGLLEIVSRGNPMLKAGASFHQAKSISLEYTAPKLEYLDAIILTEYYHNSLSDHCRKYLNHVGYVAEVIKVDKMKFQFFDKRGGAISLTRPVLDNLVEIATGISWSILEEVTLVIDSPKYIGYRLGRLKSSDQGLSLYRSSEVKNDKYIFKSIDIFETHDFIGKSKSSNNRIQSSVNANDVLPKQFHIDPHSKYR